MLEHRDQPPWEGPCLYCRRVVAVRGVEHVFPEALGQHTWTLPRGAVCDRCNGNVLRKLDDALAAHPHIGVVLMFYGVPGKGGRVRKRHGMLERDGDAVRVAPPESWIEAVHVNDELRRVATQVATPREFRPDRFCRALYKVALNVIAAVDGMPAALDSRYDRAREFIARPADNKAFLPYVQRIEPPGARVETVRFRRFKADGHDSVGLWLLAGEFFVDLISPECVADLVRSEQFSNRAAFRFHDAAGVRDWAGTLLPPHDFREPVVDAG